jgi:hypothetical protein
VQRIAVVGCGGSGKSHVSRKLGAQLGLPVTHLDPVYYDREWRPLAADEFAATQASLVAEPSWIIDGNYASTLSIRLAAADTVVFLDLPAWACLWGIVRRGRRDHRITWGFVRYVIGYRRRMAPRVRGLVAEHGPAAALIVLSSRRKVRRFLGSPAATTPPGDRRSA